MNNNFINEIKNAMQMIISEQQMEILNHALSSSLKNKIISDYHPEYDSEILDNPKLLSLFISSKKVEGCSEKSLKYYTSTIGHLFNEIKKNVVEISTNDLRFYLANYQELKNSSKVTIDNIRRIFSSFFSWLEDENYIGKSPVRRIHKVKSGRQVKEILSDEQIETLRDNCVELRDLALVELLSSTGMRVGELVRLNTSDIDFHERECIVLGKGNSQRIVYFDARTKIHLNKYLESRTDKNPALFVSLAKPYTRLTIGAIETRLKNLGVKCNIEKVHPHKFRRTLATLAIDKGMPIEQVQKLLGHMKIDTTLHYAMVNQGNVKIAHRKFIG
ncbi:site-specific tyrosine recombinase/integron integrase [Chryseobacterium koreense]|uniref:site-specific tyrosine recombinase/integron integrase n=1 Tax=Chryseobacterium koreense TaxID=232216 RepID=UPI0026E9BE3F|nr:site-specific tyrosine recombinase/integron integrase [Chryseobacterium koreense]